MKNIKFTSLNRDKIISKLKEEEYDLVVIGGGITGAGILLDASSRGMKVALLEKGDFASGTSSKSSKLIHGGLRYLKQFELSLVKEVGTERAIVHKLAPHLVIPEKMLLPLIENGSYGEWMTSIGLKVYDILANVEGDDKRKMMNKEETLELEPLLPEKILKGSGYYAEYRTDDARLTLENIKTAINYGGTPLNYAKVQDFIYANEQIKGVKVKDELNGEEYTIKTKYVINAAGPWVDELREVNHSKKGKQLHLTKGVHLVFPKDKLPLKQSVYFDIPDGRMMFAIPRGKITYAGTTDTNYTLDKNEVRATEEDADYLLHAINNMFPAVNLERKDIASSWAGLRPLIHEEGKSPSELSRKDEIFISDTGLISMAGGKLTGYRKMAERVVDKVQKKLEKETQVDYKDVFTDKIPLIGGPWKKYKEVKKYIKTLTKDVEKLGLDSYTAWYLTTTYGKQSEQILTIFKTKKGENAFENLILAELDFCIENEMVVTPMDFFIRRTGRLYFDIDSLQKYQTVILAEFKTIFNLNEDKIQEYAAILAKEIETHAMKAAKI
ncbi:glycerol-3-phosphate dehydrogenase/oxidase [uncultured Maribacter sp.]|uniref:glycerol-3-phosphate dehydrogenase/oxidase n=1 Tax=uncultured Maribacter sp. TaxID=431308 RepID=UPI002609E09F|nr:glycerol-3-phosphate dehydrogenase/oxidase [uncultured Maribacter sp.]